MRSIRARLTSLGGFILVTALLGCPSNGQRRDGAATDLPVPDSPFYPLDQTSGTEWVIPDMEVDIGRPDTYKPPDAAPVGIWTAPFFLDFEKDDGKLAGTRDWEWGQIKFKAGPNCGTTTNYPPTSGHSGTGVWGTVLNECYNPLGNNADACQNADIHDDSVLNLKATIPSTFAKARLSYWEWADYFLTFDWTEIRINGKVIKQTCTGSLPTPPTWSKQIIDISSYIGQTITIAFHFMASGVVNQAGWYLDDMAITEY